MKKLIAIIMCAALLLGLAACTPKEETPATDGEKVSFTVIVVHKDGSEKVFTCQTEEEFLGKVLVNENIVVGNYGEFGLYFNTADGETADYSIDGGWWQVFIGEEGAMVGADQIPIADGDTFKLVYTIG